MVGIGTLKRVGARSYIDRETGKRVAPEVWKPLVSVSRTYGSFSDIRSKNVGQALRTIAARHPEMDFETVGKKFRDYLDDVQRWRESGGDDEPRPGSP